MIEILIAGIVLLVVLGTLYALLQGQGEMRELLLKLVEWPPVETKGCEPFACG